MKLTPTSPYLDLLNTGITGMYDCNHTKAQLLCGCWWSQLRSSSFKGWHISTVLSPRPRRLPIGKVIVSSTVPFYHWIVCLKVLPVLSSTSSLTTQTSTWDFPIAINLFVHSDLTMQIDTPSKTRSLLIQKISTMVFVLVKMSFYQVCVCVCVSMCVHRSTVPMMPRRGDSVLELEL